MTRADGTHDRKEDHPGAVGAGAHPGTPGGPRATYVEETRHEAEKQTSARSVTRPQTA
jgi:hypothetical protein